MDRQLARHARRQHGLFTLAQALASGFSYATVRRRVAQGAWEEVEPRVFRVSVAARLTWHQRLMALTLVTGGVASGASAAALVGLLEPAALEVSVHRSRASRRHGRADVRLVTALEPGDVVHVDGIPCTHPARTLVDLAGVVEEEAFERVLDAALVRRVVTRDRLRRRAEHLWTPRRRGCAVVLRLLDQRHPEVERARNEWEALVLRLCRRYGLPDPIPNHRVRVGGRWRKIDVAWPEQRIAVEFDGFEPHMTRRVFDDDRVRQNDLVDAGWRPFRFTKTALVEDPSRAFAPVVRAFECGQDRAGTVNPARDRGGGRPGR